MIHVNREIFVLTPSQVVCLAGTVEKVSPPPEDVARLFRALAGPKGSKEISSLGRRVKTWGIFNDFHGISPGGTQALTPNLVLK